MIETFNHYYADTVDRIRGAALQMREDKRAADGSLPGDKAAGFKKKHGEAMFVSAAGAMAAGRHEPASPHGPGMQGGISLPAAAAATPLHKLPCVPVRPSASFSQAFIAAMSESKSNEDQALREMQIRWGAASQRRACACCAEASWRSKDCCLSPTAPRLAAHPPAGAQPEGVLKGGAEACGGQRGPGRAPAAGGGGGRGAGGRQAGEAGATRSLARA